MKNLTLSFVLIFFIGCARPGSKEIVNIEKTINNEALSLIDESIEHYVDERNLAGISALIAKNGQIIYQKSFGMKSVEEGEVLEDNSLFRIASMTKPITSVALLMLMEQDKVTLDSDVARFIPEFASVRVLSPEGKLGPLVRPITIKDLLMHTAGILPQNHSQFKMASPYTKDNLKECISAISGLPLIHQPGARFSYGASTNIVARVVEIISGLPFDEFVTTNIFKPLKMNSTFWVVPEREMARVASIYSADGRLELIEGPKKQERTFSLGTRGLFSTTRDYFLFAQMLVNGGSLDGKRILKEKTVRLMIKDHLAEELHPLNVMGTEFPNTGFGLGVAVINGNPKDWSPAEYHFPNLGNLPGGSFHWPGITNTFWWADPENAIVGVLLSQTNNPAAHPVFQEFHQTFYSNVIYKDQFLTKNQ